MIVSQRSPALRRAVVGAALVVAASVLVGWSAGGGVLSTWGAATSTSPWTALMIALLAIAAMLPPRARARVCAVAAAAAVLSLASSDLVVTLQGQVWPDATRAPAPGIDLAVLLLAAAIWTTATTTSTEGLGTTLAAGAAAVAVLSLVGRAIGAGWLAEAGAGSPETGMSLPSSAMILLLGVGSWLLDLERTDPLGHGGRRRHVVGAVAAVLTPVMVVWVLPTPSGPTRLDYATTALLVVVITLTTQLALVASSNRDALLAVETMLDGSPEPTLFVDATGVIVRANRATTDHFGWPGDELVGVPIGRLAPAVVTVVDDGRQPVPGTHARPSVLPPSQRVTATRRDGTGFPAEITLAPVRMRGRTLVAATIRDVTAHEQQVATLRGLQDMQSMFLTAVSHELRTPLTVVMGLAETLRGRGDDLTTPARRAVLERLLANAGRLDVLLSDLLDVDRLQRGAAGAAVALDVGEVVRAQARQSSGELGLDVEVHVEAGVPRAVADPVLLPRVVDNLLANAGKYAGGPIDVRVTCAEGGAVIVVDDHGPGVPEPLRDQVFEPFRRGMRVNAATPGVGIGLALVAGVAEAAGGRAWVQQRDDGAPGASFRVLLPGAASRDGAVVTIDANDPARSAPSTS